MKSMVVVMICIISFIPGFSLAKTVVAPDDFKFVGGFRTPSIATYAQGLTHRYIDGQLYFYTTSGAGASNGKVFRFPAPDDSNLSQHEPYSQQTTVIDYGDIFQDKLVDLNANGSTNPPAIGLSGGATRPKGLFWDEQDKRLYWTKTIAYETQMSGSDAALGYSVLDDVNHTGTGIASWRLSPPSTEGGYGNRWAFSMTHIPSDFADTYLNGKRLGVGFGGGVSVVSNGPVSNGPTLFGIDPPSLSNEDHLDYISESPHQIVNHPAGVSRAERNPSMPGLNTRADAGYTGTTNYWFLEDTCFYGVWIDTPEKEGLLVFASMGAGNADTTITSITDNYTFTVGDPGDIAAQDVIKIDVTNPSNPSYGFEQRRVSGISGNTITVETAITQGMYIGSVVQAGSWYYGGGPSMSKMYTPLYIYDPADLANSASNPTTYPPTDITPTSNENFPLNDVTYPMPGVFTGATRYNDFKGVTFDSSTNRLYIATYDGSELNNILVYELSDSADDNSGPLTRFYQDMDGDGYSSGVSGLYEFAPSESYYLASQLQATSGDCNDSNRDINPGSVDICGNAIDEDCSGSDLLCSDSGDDRIVEVSTLEELYAAFSSEQEGDTIVISPGTYVLETTALSIDADNVTVQSSTGNRNDVHIYGDVMSSAARIKSIFYFPQGANGQNTIIKDMTIGRVGWHAIFFNGDGSGNGTIIDNVRIINCYEQFLKAAVASTGTSNVTIRNSLFEFLSPALNYYTGGIDAHDPDGWVIQGNTFLNIQSPSGSVAEHAVHLWSNTSFLGSNIIERNKIVECDRGVGIWNGRGTNIIRNNMITSNATGVFNDVGIDIRNTPNSQVYNNTVWIDPDGYYAAIEFRGAETVNSYIANNLTNKAIYQFDGATGEEISNITDIDSDALVSVETGDLHITQTVGFGIQVPDLIDDYDSTQRNGMFDVGADQINSVLPPLNLQAN